MRDELLAIVGSLIEECERKVALGHDYILLTVKRKTEPRTDRVRLFGRSGPVGRYVSWVKDDVYMCDFDVNEVLAALKSLTTLSTAPSAKER